MKKYTQFSESNKYRDRIHRLIPGGAHTYSKGDDQFPKLTPAAISHGLGAWVWDIDQNKYLDCSMGLTSVSLGHAYPEVIEAVRRELGKGVNFQRPSVIEGEMAEKFLSLVPQHDMIKYAKNGSTATTAAVKLARAYTGKKLIAFPSDHPFYSYDDWFIGKTACDKGVPDELKRLTVTYNSMDLTSLENLFLEYPEQISCVISEPEKNFIQPNDYLQKLINICHANNSLYIQDEMITGFKTDLPGSIKKYNVQPDLATWGKGIANGFSFCALTGKKEIMNLGGIKNTGQEKVFLISSTHGGETHSIAAGMATIDVFLKENVIQHNHLMGDLMIQSVNEVIAEFNLKEYIQISDTNWMQIFTFRNKFKDIDSGYRTLFMQEMIARGILFQGSFVPCFSHQKSDILFFKQAFSDVCKNYWTYLDSGYEIHLTGDAIKPVFRKYL